MPKWRCDSLPRPAPSLIKPGGFWRNVWLFGWLFLAFISFWSLLLFTVSCFNLLWKARFWSNNRTQSLCSGIQMRYRKPYRNGLKLSQQGAVYAVASTPAGKVEHHFLLQPLWGLGLTSVFVIVLPCLSQMQGCVPWQTDQGTADTGKINRFSGSTEKPLISSMVSLGATYGRNPHR